MSKPSILELLARPENSTLSEKFESEFDASSYRVGDDGEIYVDYRDSTNALIDRYAAYDGDEFIGDFDQSMVLNGPENVDDTILKTGVNLIDSHNPYTVKDTFGISTAWWIKDNALYATFRLSAIAKLTGIADSIKNQTLRYVSVGAFVLQASWDRTGPRPLRTITLMQPYEVSLVIVPAIADAMILSKNPKLKEQLMSTKPAATQQSAAPAPTAEPTAPAVEPTAEVTSEPTPEQLADEALKLAGLPPRGAKVVLDAGNKDVAVLLDAAKLLDLHSVVEQARKDGKTLVEMKKTLSEAAKERAVKQAAADKETVISTEVPLASQATEQQGARKVMSGYEIIEQRKAMRSGKKA